MLVGGIRTRSGWRVLAAGCLRTSGHLKYCSKSVDRDWASKSTRGMTSEVFPRGQSRGIFFSMPSS
jgi:hypothetical protein